jgi:diguanylate cyclase (GGDEF)-like protein/PAS domain S-box-containing protein
LADESVEPGAGKELEERRAERVAHDQNLDQLSRQREAILDAAGEGICGIDAAGLITFANPAAAQMLGYTVPELSGKRLQDLLQSSEAVPWALEAAIAHAALVRDDAARIIRADGSTLPVELICNPVHERGVPTGAVACFRDATERRRFEDQLAYLSDHDALTGLFNRRRFEQELGLQLAYGERYEADLSVLVIDLDAFKDINDIRGHRVGDDLVSSIARLLRERLRSGDVVARLGADEFAVLLPATPLDAALGVAEELREAIAGDTHLAGRGSLRVTASIGVSSSEDGETTAEHLLTNADIAMHDAKDSGRDRVAAYSRDRRGRERAATRFAWAERIREAIAADAFELFVQPIQEVSSGEISQYELLLRMRGPDGTLETPNTFLPIAERHGLIRSLDRWVVKRAMAIAGLARHRGAPIRLEINLSGQSVSDLELPGFIAAEIERAGVDPTQIVFEMTETAAIDSLHRARALAQRLRELGCLFALDDFGSGFSSFVYLKHLPIDYVKIDGDFIRGILTNPSDRLFVQAIVAIAGGLGKRTVAEFVEDAKTAAVLTELGVDYLQGFHVGEPVPVEVALGSPADHVTAP